MTPPITQRRAELDEFARDLRRFKDACCVSSDRELIKHAPKVMAKYKQDIPKMRELTTTVLSDVLSGKRQRPQPWGWVATYVLACLEVLGDSGAQLDFDGPTDLQGWYQHHQALLKRLDQAPSSEAGDLPPADGSAPDADPADAAPPCPQDAPEIVPMDGPMSAPPSPPPGPPPAPAASAQTLHWQYPNDAALADMLDRLRLQQSMAHRRHYELLGQHGVDLLIAAEAGGREAACRLGILLLCHDRPAEAQAWLHAAADGSGGNESAKVLLNAAPSRRLEMAAELAYEFTLPGYPQDNASGATPTGAETYYRAATAAGHMGATVRLGLIFEARGDLTTALHTFAQAAAHCHPEGVRHYERLNTLLCRNQDDYCPGDPPHATE